MATTAPAVMCLLFYGFERLADDPLDLIFSVFALLTIMDTIHKAIIFLLATDENSTNYSNYSKFLDDWLAARTVDEESDDDNPGGLEIVSVSPDIEIRDIGFTTPEPEEWEVGDIMINNLTITYRHTFVKPSLDSTKQEEVVTNSVIMKNRNFVFKHGETTALVGESGSGKTSLLKVVAGLLLPAEGEVYIGSLQLTPATRSAARSRMALCSQDSLLFSRSLRENIWYGNPDPCDDDKILEVLDRVGMSVWYSELSSGLDHHMTAGESQVSGGQAQRLQLARLLCKNTHYVLLDEALSALDSENRKRILKYLDTYLDGKTTLWITHNSDVMNAVDNVINITI